MSSVDNRIVKMEFDNAQFKKGAADSKKSLDDLNSAVDSAGKSKGLLDLNANMQKVQVTASKTSIVVTAALATIASKATAVGIGLAKSLTIAPVLDGFREYEKLLTSAQTIRANTGANLDVVNAALDDLNHYSDKTIYNFGQMADNIGKFTAAGVKIDVATNSIKGLANTAALAGSTTDQLNTAMYQMSQALATGSIKLMDWNSLVNAGMGGKNQQKLFKQTAEAMGLNVDSMIKKAGSFRESLKDGWLTADVFSNSMRIMSGHVNKAGETVAYTVAELQKMGYAKQAATQLSRLSAAAIDSATKIKTFSQGIGVVKEAFGSGWAQIFRSLFGDLDESISMWTKFFGVITDGTDKVFGAVSSMLDQWRKLGGYQKLWAALGNIFQSIGNVLAPLGAMFKALLPQGNGAGNMLYSLTDALFKFSVWLENVTEKLKVLTPIFTVIGLVLRDVGGRIFDLVSQLGNIKFSGSGFKDFGRNLITGLINGLVEWGPKVVGIIVGIAVSLWDAFASFFGIHSPSIRMTKAGYDLMQGLANGIRGGLKWASEAMKDVIRGLDEAFMWIVDMAGKINWDRVFDIAKLIVLWKIFKMLDLYLRQIPAAIMSVAGSIAKFSEGVASMGIAMKRAATAELIKSIAISVAVLVASLWVLTKIPEDKLKSALISLAEGLAILVVAFVAISRFVNSGGVISLTKGLMMAGIGFAALGLGLIQLGIGLLIFKLIKPSEMIKAGYALGAIAAGLLLLSAVGKANVAGAGKAMLAVSLGLLALGHALIIFKLVKPAEMVKVAFALLILTSALVVLSRFAQYAVTGAVAFGILAVGLGLLAAAIFAFFLINPEDIHKVAAALFIVGAAGIIFGKMISSLIPGVVGMVALALGIAAMAGALLLFQNVDWETIFKGLTALLLLGAVAALGGVLVAVLVPGALAMVAMAVGIAAFAASLLLLQLVDWSTIAKGIVGLLAIGTLAVVLGVVSPALFIAGAGLLVFAAGLLAATTALVASAYAVQYFWDVLSSTFGGITAWVKGIFGINSPSTVFADIGTNLMLGLVQGIVNGARSVLSVMGALGKGMYSVFKSGLGNVISWGADIALGLAKGVRDFASHPVTSALNMAKSVAKSVMNFFGIHSPSTLMAGYGGDLMAGFENGIDGNSGGVMNSISSVMNGINGIIADGVNTGKSYIQGLLADYNNSVANLKVAGTKGEHSGPGAAAAKTPDTVDDTIKQIEQVKLPKVGGGGGAKSSGGGGGGGGASKAKARAAKAKQLAAKRAQKVLDDRAKAIAAIDKKYDAQDAARARAEATAARNEKYAKSSTAERAQMRGEEAKTQLQQARDAQELAEEHLAEARVLEKAAKAKGTSKAQAKKYIAAAKILRKNAADQTKASAAFTAQSRQSSADSLALQMKSAQEAEKDYQKMYDEEAKADADADKFDKMTDSEKAALRRQQAQELQAKSIADLEKAKKLAYTDLAAANALAEVALNEADLARDYLKEAESLSLSGGSNISGAQVINIDPAALAMAGFKYDDLYSDATAAAAGKPTIQFNQYNSSPESLNPTDIYRNTNNQLTFASEKISEAA